MYSNVKIFNTVNIGHTFMSFCDARDCSMHSSVHGIFQARIVEWVTISFSGEFSRHEYWSGVPLKGDRQSIRNILPVHLHDPASLTHLRPVRKEYVGHQSSGFASLIT